jgi:lipooligosaccharide transport system ATP-binding protein
MKRRLLLARSLLNDPELLILDEPTTGLDPQARHLIWEKLRHLKTENVTQILTTHYMEEASQICDRVVIMDQGKIKAEGEPHSLVRQFVSREVLELRINPKRRSEVLSLLGNIAESFESHNDLLLFYTRDAESLYRILATQNLQVDYALYRQSTLEDVFLKLTGRRLRE